MGSDVKDNEGINDESSKAKDDKDLSEESQVPDQDNKAKSKVQRPSQRRNQSALKTMKFIKQTRSGRVPKVNIKMD